MVYFRTKSYKGLVYVLILHMICSFLSLTTDEDAVNHAFAEQAPTSCSDKFFSHLHSSTETLRACWFLFFPKKTETSPPPSRLQMSASVRVWQHFLGLVATARTGSVFSCECWCQSEAAPAQTHIKWPFSEGPTRRGDGTQHSGTVHVSSGGWQICPGM